MSTPKIRGGAVISRLLAAEGVERVFGIVDGTYFGLCASLKPNGIQLITPRHEACAAHMAGAYARLSGKLGVCIASNGPGVANMLTGVAVEQAEGNRVLLITSCRREGIINPDRGGAYQFFPQVETIRPMAKWSCDVPSIDRLAELLRRALRQCFIGRPGVVHLDVPETIINGTYEENPLWFRPPTQQDPPCASQSQVEQAARMLITAQRPLIHAGSGTLHAQAHTELAELADFLQAPVTTSWGARTVIDERHPSAVSMIYVEAVSQARNQTDLALVLGSRLGETDWWGKPPYWATPEQQSMIQVDLDPEVLGNVRPVALPIQADVRTFLRSLLDYLRSLQPNIDFAPRRALLESLQNTQQNRRIQLDKHLSDTNIPMHPAHVATVCQQTFPEDAILISDGGNTTIWAQFYHQNRTPNSMVGTPKMGMLGAGVSQALGAKIAFPNRPVYCIIGDGAFGFHPQEIETAIRNNLAVIYLVLCDKQWGMVKMNQQFALNPLKTVLLRSLDPTETINTDLGEIEFDILARSMGAYGERVADPHALRWAIQRAISVKRCAVIHVDVDPVKHMWAPNLKDFKDMHQEPPG